MSPKWKKIAWIEFWLGLFPPWGVWLLWKDTLLTPPEKRRVLFYTIAIPLVVMFALSLYMMRATEQAIQAAGGY